jgi:AGZA family xanthine/uracil permease-like MFS transporter
MQAVSKSSPPLFVRGDLDGFFGLMVDNLVQVLLIVAFCREVLHFPDALVFGRVLPGVAISLLVGNLYYARQARRLAEATGRDDVTALPYGINTPSVFAYVFLVMLPVWFAGAELDPTLRAERAWQAGLVACFLSGVIETAGSLIGPLIRRITPRAALLAALSGIAVTFISMDFALRIFRAPLVGLLGLGFVLAHYMSRRGLPFGLPAGGLAVVVGTVFAVITDFPRPDIAVEAGGLALPLPVIGDLIAGFRIEGIAATWSVILTMGLLNVVGTLQNVESAEAAGDSYEVRPTMVVNGLGTIVASLFGSCFPTTVYIGHPGWKAMGARSAYSTMNGLFWIVIVVGGLAAPIARLVPVEAGAAIVVWIAIIITAQAFQATPRRHAPAVAFGLFPALAAWVVIAVGNALRATGVTPDAAAIQAIDSSGTLPITGALHLWSGFLFTATIWAAMGANLIDHRFRGAAWWSLAACILSAVGLIHGYRVDPTGPVEVLGFGSAGWAIPACYLAFAALFLVQGARGEGSPDEAAPEPETA